MSEKEGVDFDIDERTEVPTYEEVSGAFSSFKKSKKHKKKKTSKAVISPEQKPKNKHFFKWAIIIFVIILVLVGIYFAYTHSGSIKNSITKSNKAITGMITGYFGSCVDYENKSIWGVEINGVSINLTDEERKINESLEMKYNLECEQKKGEVAKDIRDQEESQCNKEKSALQDEIDELNDRIDSLETKLDNCNDDD